MPNKNSVLRYHIIDDIISNPMYRCNMKELVDRVNSALRRIDPNFSVCRRTVETNLNEMESIFDASILRDGRYIRYEQPGFSVFSKKMTDEEKSLLKEVFTTIGQFDGLPNFPWLESLRQLVEDGTNQNKEAIISFSNCDVKNKNLLATFYSAISSKTVTKVLYKPFGKKPFYYYLHPYLLKEYNNRWFVLGGSKNHKNITNFALDRIEKVEFVPNEEFVDKSDLLKGYFDNVVGISVEFEEEPKDITFWANNHAVNYVETKKLHQSQTGPLGSVEDRKYRKLYPSLNEGKFYRMRCQINKELDRVLTSFLDEILVIEPAELRNRIAEKIKRMNSFYNSEEKNEERENLEDTAK